MPTVYSGEQLTVDAAYSSMTAITSQAAVALLDNQGNLTKTLAALSSSNSDRLVVGGTRCCQRYQLRVGEN